MTDETYAENSRDAVRDCRIPSEDDIRSVYPDRDPARVEAYLNFGASTRMPSTINMNRIEPSAPGVS